MGVAMSIVTYLTMVIFFAAHTVSYAYIYRMHTMQYGDDRSSGKRVIALSDYHDKKHPATIAQKIHLRDILHRCKSCKAHVIVEDLSSANTRGINGCGNYGVNSRGGILGGLSSTCKRMNLEVSNLEYRFCRVAAFAPLLNSNMMRGPEAHSSYAISMNDVYEEIVQQIDKIDTFDDGPVLNAWYRQHIELICQDLKVVCSTQQKTMNIAQYMQSHSDADRLQLLKKLLTFDSILFDLDLVHTIVSSDHTTIVVIAGGMHVENMCSMLEKIGYVYTNKIVSPWSVYNAVHYFKSMIQGGDMVKPVPVDLNTVKPCILK
jgi:hypothetical protein